MDIKLLVAIVSGLFSLVCAGFAYMSRRDVVRLQAALQHAHERHKPFLERQMQHYFEAAEVTSKIANLDESPERQEAIKRFWQLYWGPLAVVENPNVEAAMVKFGDGLRQEHPQKSKLQTLSLNLAHACRDSLAELWGANLGELKHLREAH